MFRRQRLVHLAHHATHLRGVLDESLVLVDLDGRQRGRAAERMAVVGETAVERLVPEVVGDAPTHAHRAERYVGTREALGHRDEIGHDVPVIHAEPPAGAAESRHDLVADQQDAVLVAQRAHALQVAVGRNEDAVGAADGLEDERRDVFRALELDDFLEIGQRLRRGVPSALQPVIRVEHMNHARNAGLGAPPPRIAGEREAAGGAAVVGAIARQNLVATGDGTDDSDRVLVRLGAAVGEEEDVDVAGRDLGQLGAQAGARFTGHERVHVGELRRLILDRLHDRRMAVTGVDAHQLAVEVDVALALGRPEVHAPGPGDGDRVHRALHRPLVQTVLPAQRHHFVAGHPRRGHRLAHRPSPARRRGANIGTA